MIDLPFGCKKMENQKNPVEFEAAKCIVSQTADDNPLSIPTEQGRASMKRASDIRNDSVSKRLKFAEDQALDYVYHNVNQCFKAYVRKGELMVFISLDLLDDNDLHHRRAGEGEKEQ